MIWDDPDKRKPGLKTKVLFCCLAMALASHTTPWAADEAAALFEKGMALRSEGKHREALEAFQGVLLSSPSHVEALVQMGAILEDLGKLQEATKCYRSALKIKGSHAAARRNLEQLEAARVLNDPPKTVSPARESLIQLGLRAMEMHDPQRALGFFRVSRGVLDRDPRPLFYSAIALERQGKKHQAIALYEQTVTAFPDFAPAWTNLIVALVRSSEPAEAVTKSQDARRAVPDDRRIQWLAEFSPDIASRLKRLTTAQADGHAPP